MPYIFKKENGKYCVYKKDNGKKVGCTDGTKEALKKYLIALRMHEENQMSAKKIENSTIHELKKMVAVAVKDVLKEGITMQRKVQQQQEQEQPALTAEEKKVYLEAISKFNEYGDAIYRGNNLKEALKNIKQVVEFASRNMVEESGDWFDGVTVSRHSKRMQESMKIFEKAATETIKLQQRMESVYEDMGHMLSRYYEIKDGSDDKSETPEEPIKESTITESELVAYKLRAEAPVDILRFVQIAGINLKDINFNEDNIFEFKTTIPLNKIINLLKKVPDGHVMIRTVQPAKLYTGKEVRKESKQPVKEVAITETQFYAFWNQQKHEIDGKDLYDAKLKAIEKLKIPKSKQGLLAIMSKEAYDEQQFRSESTKSVKEADVNQGDYPVGSKNVLFHKSPKPTTVLGQTVLSNGYKTMFELPIDEKEYQRVVNSVIKKFGRNVRAAEAAYKIFEKMAIDKGIKINQ